MPDLLLELFSEEIPARMQRRAAEDLKSLLTNALVDAGVTYEGAKAYATPRRLALHIAGLPAGSKATREERKGPRVGAPEKALAGFLRGAGLSSIDDAEVQNDPKKGDFYVAVIEKPGRKTEDIVADVMPDIIRNFPWPKSSAGVRVAYAGFVRCTLSFALSVLRRKSRKSFRLKWMASSPGRPLTVTDLWPLRPSRSAV